LQKIGFESNKTDNCIDSYKYKYDKKNSWTGENKKSFLNTID